MKRLIIALTIVLFAAAPALAAPPASTRVAPLPGHVVRSFSMGAHTWDPGHRGIDISGTPGEQVVAAASGTVSWIGSIDDVPMLSIDHAGVRSTYQPVSAHVRVGQRVTAGETIGTLDSGHCPPDACLHFGVKVGERYLDPARWLRSDRSRVRLLPLDARIHEAQPGLPADGPVTSPFGYRTHPITGATSFHDGVDIGAACGEPVSAMRAGTVTFAGVRGGFGNRVEIDHGDSDGVWVGSSYSHLSSISVRVGQRVEAREALGQVGTTGFSTGCHLHWSVTHDGVTVDPLG